MLFVELCVPFKEFDGYVQICKKIRGPGCVIRALGCARVTHPSPHIFLHFCICISTEYREFDPSSAAVQEYDDQAYQDIYYVAESFSDAMEKFRYNNAYGYANV